MCVLGTGCTIVSWVEKFRTSEWRPYRAMMFIGLGVSGVIPVVQGLFIYGYRTLEDRMSLSLVIIHGVIYIFGAVLYAVSAFLKPSFRCLHLTVDAGSLARTDLSWCIRYLGQLSPDLPCLRSVSRGDAFLRNVKGI